MNKGILNTRFMKYIVINKKKNLEKIILLSSTGKACSFALSSLFETIEGKLNVHSKVEEEAKRAKEKRRDTHVAGKWDTVQTVSHGHPPHA